MFIKKCSTRQRQEPRSFTVHEVMTVSTGLLNFAHQGAVSKIRESSLSVDEIPEPKDQKKMVDTQRVLETDFSSRPLNLLETTYFNALINKDLQAETNIFAFVAYFIRSNDVAASVNELTHGNLTPSLLQKVNDAVSQGRDTTVTQSCDQGTWTIKLFKDGQGSWTVSTGM